MCDDVIEMVCPAYVKEHQIQVFMRPKVYAAE